MNNEYKIEERIALARYGKEKMNKAATMIGDIGINGREWKANRLEVKMLKQGLVALTVQ